MDREKVKTKANELSELLLHSPNDFRAAYDSGEFTEAERSALLPLCNVYDAFKRGITTRARANREQHRIIVIAELKEASVGEVSTI